MGVSKDIIISKVQKISFRYSFHFLKIIKRSLYIFSEYEVYLYYICFSILSLMGVSKEIIISKVQKISFRYNFSFFKNYKKGPFIYFQNTNYI